LSRLHRFHEQRGIGFESAGPTQHLVGAFVRLDGEHRSLAHHAALAEIETRTFASDMNAVVNVIAFDRKIATDHASLERKLVVEKRPRIKQGDTQLYDFPGNR